MPGPAALLAVAASQIGVTEDPPGSNRTPYGAWFGWNGVAWCDQFVSWCGDRSGNGAAIPRSQYVPTRLAQARAAGHVVAGPAPGDLVCFDWGRDGIVDHIGIVEQVRPGELVTIEGNTSPDDHGSQSNGGGVWRRHRPRTLGLTFIRPPYQEDDDVTLAELAGWDISALVGLPPKTLNFQTAFARLYAASQRPAVDVEKLAAAVVAHLPGEAQVTAAAIADELARRLQD